MFRSKALDYVCNVRTREIGGVSSVIAGGGYRRGIGDNSAIDSYGLERREDGMQISAVLSPLLYAGGVDVSAETQLSEAMEGSK